MIEIDKISEFEHWIHKEIYTPVAVQELDIIAYESHILSKEHQGSLFLGCKLTKIMAGHISLTGGLVISSREDFLFPIHKAHLYSPEELFEGFSLKNNKGYKSTYDYKIYQNYVDQGMENPSSILISLARRLHDHSMTDALHEMIDNRKVVAIMGGHGMERSDIYYSKIAKISRLLTQKGYLMVSGGGPGAMEATHLGAYFSSKSETDLETAINAIKIRPNNAPKGKEYEDEDWLKRAMSVKADFPLTTAEKKMSISIGIPTWLYGHEPPATFATHIAKYFANSVREDGLLTIAKYGVIFAPGSAGTIQEIFQDATQNHYAPYHNKSFKKHVSPMLLMGVNHWTKKKPLWSFIQKVSDGLPYGSLLKLTDDSDEIIKHILEYDPEEFAYPK